MTDQYFDLDAGDDTTGDGSIGNPWQTLSKAATTAGSGFSAILKDGIYVRAAGLDTFLPVGVSVTSESGDPNLCSVDGTSGDMFYWSMEVHGTGTVSGIKFINMEPVNPAGIIYGELDSVLTVNNCIFEDCGTAATNRFIIGQRFDNSNMTVTGCIFIRCWAPTSNAAIIGLGSSHVSTSITVDKCTFLGDTTNGNYSYIGAYGVGATQVTVTNCIIYHRASQAALIIRANAGNDTSYSYSCGYTIGGALTNQGVDTEGNNITDDPLFLDITNGNIRLQPTSPCIDRGTVV